MHSFEEMQREALKNAALQPQSLFKHFDSVRQQLREEGTGEEDPQMTQLSKAPKPHPMLEKPSAGNAEFQCLAYEALS